MYNTKTNQGWEILSTIQSKGATHIVVKRYEGNYAWGSYYNVETGNWGQGHYDYPSQELALQDLIEFVFDKKLVDKEEADSLTFNEMLNNFVDAKIEEAKEEECQLDSGDFRQDFIEGIINDYDFEFEEAYERYQEATEEFEE
jgi:hypothetical protein